MILIEDVIAEVIAIPVVAVKREPGRDSGYSVAASRPN
jgi:hypothetical protein